jgi:hypothetical protein
MCLACNVFREVSRLTSVGDPRWERLSAPAKAAVQWARATMYVRTGSWQDAFDSLDLLAGIFLADLTGSPARLLFEHFGIPPGEVLERPDAPATQAQALLAAVGNELRTSSPLDRAIDEILQLATIGPDADRADSPVPLPDLFGALLVNQNPASRSIKRSLAVRRVDPDAVIQAYWRGLASREPLADFLDRVFPHRIPGVALPAYLADQVDPSTDLVGIGPEVDAFAHLIAYKRLVPPLAVGLFGDWGSGKSYFLRSLQRRIDQVASAEMPVFHRSIVQIEFNAWQYVGGDLWAGLIEHLFRNLRLSGDTSDDLVGQRQRFWVEQVQAADEAHQQARKARQELEHQRETAADEVKDREEELRKAAEDLAQAKQASPSRALRKAVADAARTAGFSEVTDNAVKLANELDQARNDLRSLLTPLRDKKYLAFVLTALVLTPVIAYATRQIDLSTVSAVAWLLGTAAGYAAMAGRFLRNAGRRIADARAALAEAEAREHQRVEQEVQQAQRRLDTVESELAGAVAKERQLVREVEEARREQQAATPGQVLTDFINERLGSEDYRRHLGLPALVRRDLERLSRLVEAAATAAPGQYPIDRIVLYIDDLDRCPTPVVIKVLEAVHLLLAFKLFVVVVAVDARWLTSSLRDHYRQLAGPDATPEDYLEKIFQVPFRVRPLQLRTRAQMLQSLLTPSVTRTGRPAAFHAAGEDVTPQADLDEFKQVVASFATTSGPTWQSEPVDLTITPAELSRAKEVAELLGSTPRAVKRFANVYLLVKSIGTGRGWEVPGEGQLAVLLAIAIGLPRVAAALFASLNPALHGQTLTGLVPPPSEQDPQYEVFDRWVHEVPSRDFKVAGLTGWLELIDRFRFPEGRAAGGPGRMER